MSIYDLGQPSSTFIFAVQVRCMKKVTLLFRDERNLRRFTMIVTCGYLEMDVKALRLICDCDDAEIELAQKGFNATVEKIETDPS